MTNSLLSHLQPYPFERLRQLFSDVKPNADYSAISLGIGEPKHATPEFIKTALCAHLDGLAIYPPTIGTLALRESIANWFWRRYEVKLNESSQILPVNGSREALFSLTQTVVDTQKTAQKTSQKPFVVCPNPFYQIYEGAALLAGAQPYFVASDEKRQFASDWMSVDDSIWKQTQLLIVCSPNNPTGAVMLLPEWKQLFDLSEKFGFVIASDECYSEIYFRDEAPLGVLQAAKLLNRDFKRLICLTSLSKRSNVPGLRSGFVAGDEQLIKNFLLYRTYHGSAMSPIVSAASQTAWDDEQHVIENRALYREKFAQVTPILSRVLDVQLPDAGFYLWAKIPEKMNMSDTEFARELIAQYNVTVLPGSYLAREFNGKNPGQNRIRMALVAQTSECLEAANRIHAFCNQFLK